MIITKEIKLTATSKSSDGESIAVFNATISTVNPDNITYNMTIVNQALYRANRTQVREDQFEFEDALYLEQDTMLNSMTTTE